MDVSENRGTAPKIIHFNGFSIIFTIHFGVFPYFGNTHISWTCCDENGKNIHVETCKARGFKRNDDQGSGFYSAYMIPSRDFVDCPQKNMPRSGWWLNQPSEKDKSNWTSSPFRGEKKKVWNHIYLTDTYKHSLGTSWRDKTCTNTMCLTPSQSARVQWRWTHPPFSIGDTSSIWVHFPLAMLVY